MISNKKALGRPGHGANGGQPLHTQYSTNSARLIPVYVGKKTIGHVKGDTFHKVIKGSRHMLRRPKAIAFDVSTLHDAQDAGARYVEVKDSETGKAYKAAMSTVWAKGWEFNRGYGRQWGVPICEWNKDNQPAQLSLLERMI